MLKNFRNANSVPTSGFELVTSYMQSSYVPNQQHQIKLTMVR